ncbi:MAG: Ribosomal-protein-S5p-alanine acetyltransferase, partial [uncultured Nocardioides sp.]
EECARLAGLALARGHHPASARGRGRRGLARGAPSQRRLAQAVGRHRATGCDHRCRQLRPGRPTSAQAGSTRTVDAVRHRGRRPVRRSGDGQQHRPRIRAVRLPRLLARPVGRRSRGDADRRRDGHRPLLHHRPPPPDRDLHPPGEHQLAARGREARPARGGLRPAIPSHRRGLARPPDLRRHGRGVPRRDPVPAVVGVL